MEVVRQTNAKDKRKRIRLSKSAALQSLIARTLRKMYTPTRLEELLESLPKPDQARFILYMGQYMFTKPAPAKDEVDQLSSQQVNELYEKILNHAK